MPDKKESNTSTVENAIGKTLAIAAVTLIGLVIIALVVSNLPYRIDPNLPIPTLDDYNNHTNEESVTISGETIPGENIILYIDEELYKEKVASDPFGYFEFENIPVENEGEYKFEAAVARGFILRKKSENSNTIVVNVDRTSPSSDMTLDYQEISSSDKVEIRGSAEPNTKVIISNDEGKYEAKTEDNGDFQFTDIPVTEGENTFNITIEDFAGNSTEVSKTITITKESGDLNGDGASDQNPDNSGTSELPESAGELEAAMATLMGNKLMTVFAVISVIALITSSAIAYTKSKKLA